MSQLISKTTNLPIKKVLYNGKVHAPLKAKSYDLVKVIGRHGEKTDIVTFREKAGDILRRYIIKKGIFGTKIIERNYQKLKEALLDNPENPLMRDFLKVTGRKISSVTKLNGEFFEKSEEIQTITHRKNNSNVVHIKKLTSRMLGKSEVEDETQSLFEYRKDAPKKGYEVKTCLKSKLGFLNDIFAPEYKFFNFDKKTAEAFEDDPYFLLHLYSNKEFKRIAPTCSKRKDHKVIFEPSIKWLKKEDVNGSWNHEGGIELNKEMTNKLKIINVSAHEREHCFQDEQCVLHAIKNNKSTQGFPMSENRINNYRDYIKSGGKYQIIASEKELKEYSHNLRNYIQPADDLNLYRAQILERHANIAGAMAEKEYKRSSRNLKEEFLFAPDYLIGASIKDILDRE